MSSNKPHQQTIDLIHLQFVVVILSFTAVIGKFITLPADMLVLWRLTFAVLGLYIYLKFTKKWEKVTSIEKRRYLLIGSVVAVHWLTFFGSIKLANISVCLVAMSSTTLFTSILEPLILKKRFNILQFVLGLIVIAAISYIFSSEFSYASGFIVGLISATLAALFSVLNKRYTPGKSSLIAGLYELSGAWITMLFAVLIFGNRHLLMTLPSTSDLAWIAVLGLVCTSYAFTASIMVLRSLSAYVTALSINMEPVYGIALGYLFFAESETMSNQFYIGAVIVFLSVLLYPILNRNREL